MSTSRRTEETDVTTATAEPTATKSFRTTEDAKAIVTRLAALQDLHDGELLDAMIDAYLLVHSASFAHAIPEAAAVVAAKPREVEGAIARFRAFLAGNFRLEQKLPTVSALPSARERLRAKRAEIAAR